MIDEYLIADASFCFTRVKGIIFDLDDTLVKTQLDFIQLKKDLACPRNEDILSFISQIDVPSQRKQAEKKVLEHELADAQTSTWMPYAKKFVEQSLEHKIPLAIVTRNCRQATNIKINNNAIPIKTVLTREDAPPKPHPGALLKIANNWNIKCCEIAYIGDYIYDVQAAHNANMQAWLYQPNQNQVSTNFADKLNLINKNE